VRGEVSTPCAARALTISAQARTADGNRTDLKIMVATER
jgi:hypothetical protein